jgi:hypothetical protein
MTTMMIIRTMEAIKTAKVKQDHQGALYFVFFTIFIAIKGKMGFN